MSATDTSRLTRDLHPMPDFVRDTLKSRRLTAKYAERPAYQRNDYSGWITRAKRQETKEKRLNQMLDELASGGVYMGMKWNGGE
jgi:uncharacterized protein YdeI (YjbR/CyaY-like superfamily)